MARTEVQEVSNDDLHHISLSLQRVELHQWAKRFLSRCRPDPVSECVIYQGGDDGRGGYGRTRIPEVIAITLDCKSGKTASHRASYVIAREPFDPSLQLDHLCLNKMCVNPYHLEPVTAIENARRANLRKTELAELPAHTVHTSDYDHPLLEEGI